MLLASLLLASASAADLDLELTVPNADPVHVVLADVRDGKLPGLLVEADDGTTYRLGAEMASKAPDQHMLFFVLESVETDRKGRQQATTLARPTMNVLADQESEFNVGTSSATYSIRFTVRDEG